MGNINLEYIPKEITIQERLKQYIDLKELCFRDIINKWYVDWEYDEDFNTIDMREENMKWFRPTPASYVIKYLSRAYHFKKWQIIRCSSLPMSPLYIIVLNAHSSRWAIDESIKEFLYKCVYEIEYTDEYGLNWLVLKYESTKQTLNDYLAKENIKYLICHIPKCYEHKIDEHGIMGGLIFKDRLLSMKDIPYYYSSDYSKPFNERYIRLMKDNALKVEKINPSFEFVTYKIRLNHIINSWDIQKYKDLPNCCCNNWLCLGTDEIKKCRTIIFNPYENGNKEGSN